MENWLSVTVLKLGKEVRIILTVPCPECGGEIPLAWTGSPKMVYPSFPIEGTCNACQSACICQVPEKSILRWWYLAKLELDQLAKEDQERHAACIRGCRCKKSERTRVTRKQIDCIRQQYYGILLQDRRAS